VEYTGSFPYSYGPQSDIDNVEFIPEFSVLDGVVLDPDYPNFWNLLTFYLQELILAYAENCFCIGEGLNKLRLTTGRARFPTVSPIPWVYIPLANTPLSLTVRPKNPDGRPLPDTCCPDGELPGIDAAIVGGQLQLTRRDKPEKEYIIRKADSSEKFQLVSGYPRWCCLPHPNEPGKYVMRYLTFPVWPRVDTHNPTPDAGGGTEPVGVIPIVVDIGCTSTGELAIYWANLKIHDGKISDITWDTPPPRSGLEATWDYAVAPNNPESLALNTDYQGAALFTDGFAAPIAADGIGDTCDLAAAELALVPCAGVCPDDVDICPIGGVSVEVFMTMALEEQAIDAAYAVAQAAIDIIGCTEPIYLCKVEELNNGDYKATVKYCCP
jgi:hypothetical protein